MSHLIKKIMYWIGNFLALAGIVYITLRLSDYTSQIDLSRFDVVAWVVVAALVLLYGFANIMLALAWRNLLVYFGANTSRLLVVRIYGLTQLAKYVPGNIFHLIGRQAMGLAEGIPGLSLAKASLWEVILISIAGALFGILVLPHFVQNISTSTTAVGFLCVLFIMITGLTKYIGPQSARALILYVLFLSVSGMVFVWLLALIVGANSTTPAQEMMLCGAFIVAWFAGFVTPGAPAGVGVRELVLIFLLNNYVSEADLLLAILLGRLVTVCGDFLFYLVSIVIPDVKDGLEFTAR